MSSNSIAFIYCVNNRLMYEESVRYINSLDIPTGYKIEIIPIENAMSMASGYNLGMSQTDAKFKVYLHQDLFILNKNFLIDIISVFDNHQNLGVIGVVGAKTILNGENWKSTPQTYGKIYDSHLGKMELINYKEVSFDYESVQIVDGCIMVTQYDIEWREDLFADDWYFYNFSQCQEFLLAGFDIGVVHQIEAWCLHDCGIKNTVNIDKNNKATFYEIYGENIRSINKRNLPLVSVLIPAYNRPHYLELALKSVLDQTYPNIEVIISDDSTNDEVKNMLIPYLEKNHNIQYFKNDPPLERDNMDRCFELANGEYINFLMDDDLFHTEKIEKMIRFFQENENVTLVTSHRQLINEKGEYLNDIPATRKLYEKTTIVNGRVLADYVLTNNLNVIGEPTTVLFRKLDLEENFGYYRGKRLDFVNDIVSWISLLKKGNAVYISESLSYFRQHPGQNQKNLKYLKTAIEQWVDLITYAHQDGFLNIDVHYKKALNNILQSTHYILNNYINANKTELLYGEPIINSVNIILNEITDYKSYCSCVMCGHNFERFLPLPDIYHSETYIFENYNKNTALCPSCKAFDRERMYKLYMQQETNLLSSSNKDYKLLHIAPEALLRDWLSNFKNIRYVCADLYPKDPNMIKMDITNIQYDDETFDVILCSHVLEHIPDDRKAMDELYRVLKRGGWGILQVPVALNLFETFEDPTIITPEERLKFFGQEDHVRVYAKNDYVKRLESVGFYVKQFNFASKYGEDEIKKHGFSYKDILYIVSKL